MFPFWWFLLVALSTGAPSGDWLGCPESLTAGSDSTIVVPVRIRNATDFTSAEMALAYDPAVLEPVAVSRTGLTNDWELSYAVESPGILEIFLHGGGLPAARDDLVWIVFRVVGSAGDESAIRWIDCDLDSGQEGPGLTDGHVRVVASATTLSLPDDLVGGPGESVIAPMTAAPADGILGADITVEFNELVVEPIDVTRTPITQNATLTTNLAIPGKILISLFSTTPFEGSGPIVDIEFGIVGMPGEFTPLDITRADLNEGTIDVTVDDGMIEICDDADADADQVSSCDGDCDDDNPDAYPGGTEVCDGADNDCDGEIDNVPPPVELVTVLAEKLQDGVRLSWSTDPEATGYDVVRGSLTALIAGDGDFTGATEICLVDDDPATQIDDFEDPPSPGGFWYLVRAINCGGDGSYDGGGLQQVDGRDAEIEDSAESCP